MNTNKWISINSLLPKNGKVVETKIDDSKGCRNQGFLIRQDNLWFMTDMKMYVYYTPTHWREI